jgi:hypothetical protein
MGRMATPSPAPTIARMVATSPLSNCYFLAYYIGSSVFGVAGTALWASGRWPAVAVMAAILLLIPAALAVRLPAAEHS